MGYTFIISLIIYLILVDPVNAVTTSISNIPESITSDPFSIQVTVSGATAGTNYLRIDLYQLSSTNYFGETFNGLGWYSDNDPTQYYSINIEPGKDWAGEVQGRIGNPSSTQYEKPGIYKLRLRRYTSSGNYNSTEANNSAIDINIGTPLSVTSVPSISSPIPTIEESEQLNSPTVNPQTYNNLYISEVMIDPDVGFNEWVELYNANGFEVVLLDWYIDDMQNSGSTTKKFSLTIPSKSYLSVDLTGSVFNNGGDNVRLLDFTETEIDSFQYDSSEKNKTLGRSSFEDDNFCLQNSSKNNPNNSCLNPTTKISKSSPTITPLTASAELIHTPIASTQATLITYPLKFPVFKQVPLTKTEENKASEVLGINIENDPKNSSKNHALISSLSFASFSYSLLSILSILYKIKNNF